MAFKKKDRTTPSADTTPAPTSTAVITDDNAAADAAVATLFGSVEEPPTFMEVSATPEQRQDIARWSGRLGELLTGSNLISPAELDEALAIQAERGGRLGEILVATGLLDEMALAHALAEIFGIGVANLQRDTIEPDVLPFVPEALARQWTLLPIRLEGNALLLAVADRLPPDVVSQIEQTSGHRVSLAIAPYSRIRRAIDANYRATNEVQGLVRAFESIELSRRPTEAAAPETVSEDAPVVQVVTRILTQAVRDRASDVHIEPTQGSVRVRFRIDGALSEVLELPVGMGPSLVSRIKVMSEMNIVERRRPQDGQFQIEIDGAEVDVRVATIATIWGEQCTMRILDKTRSVLSLNELGMPRDTHANFKRIVRSPFGMVLCAGPTGSGKTTTLYAILQEITDNSRNVMTIEDPVEYVLPKINQIQTNDQAGLTFAAGLRSILRQDPDVILVGEIRDVDTARIAVQSALTGHLVLSSVHSTDAVSALHRFLDMGIESFFISSSVIAIVGQRLLRRICPSCKEEYTPSDEELAFYNENGGAPKTAFFHGTGCNFCSGTGYHDRIGVFEVLPITTEIKRLVVGWASQDELQQMAEKQGMRSMRREALNLVQDDVTTISEVIRSIHAL